MKRLSVVSSLCCIYFPFIYINWDYVISNTNSGCAQTETPPYEWNFPLESKICHMSMNHAQLFSDRLLFIGHVPGLCVTAQCIRMLPYDVNRKAVRIQKIWRIKSQICACPKNMGVWVYIRFSMSVKVSLSLCLTKHLA